MEKDFIIHSTSRIAWVLQALSDTHQLIDIGFTRYNEGGRSIVVDVDPDQGAFFIDQLPSTESHNLATDGELFNIRATLNGVDIKIPDISIENIVKDSDGDMYQVRLPSSMQYIQRRETFRARVRGLQTVLVSLSIPNIEFENEDEPVTVCDALLLDLSSEGCSLSFNGAEDSSFAGRDQPLLLEIQLPSHKTPVRLFASTRHSFYLKRLKLWQIGCRIEEIDVKSQQLIDSFIAEMQQLGRQKDAMFS